LFDAITNYELPDPNEDEYEVKVIAK